MLFHVKVELITLEYASSAFKFHPFVSSVSPICFQCYISITPKNRTALVLKGVEMKQWAKMS